MSDLEARIAEVLAAHSYCPPHYQEPSMRCACGQWSRLPSIDEAGFQHHRQHVAAMLAPVIVDALRETSKAAAERNDDTAPDYECAAWSKWIAERADELEKS